MLLVVHLTLEKMVVTDGNVEEVGVVVETFAMEADPITVTCRLEKPKRKKPPFLRWVGHGLSRGWNQYQHSSTNYSAIQ